MSARWLLEDVLEGARLARSRRKRLEDLIDELVKRADHLDANATYWHRQATRARRVQEDRERYIKMLEAERAELLKERVAS